MINRVYNIYIVFTCKVLKDFQMPKKNKCTIMIHFSQNIFKYTVPLQWSINKIKCLVSTQIPKITFDEFQLAHKNKLVIGSYKLYDILTEEQMKEDKVDLQLNRTQSHIKFQQYYRQTMGQFIAITDCEYHPLLNSSYGKTLGLLKQEKQQQRQEVDQDQLDDIIANENENAGQPWLFTILRALGILIVASIIRAHGTIIQIAVIIAVLLLYFYIQIQRLRNARILRRNNNEQNNANRRPNNNQRRGQQNNDEQAQDLDRPRQYNLKGQLTLRFFKILQIVYAFCISFFPNWDVRVHLHRNSEYLRKAKMIVNSYRPQTYIIQGQNQQNNQNAEQVNNNEQEQPLLHNQ